MPPQRQRSRVGKLPYHRPIRLDKPVQVLNQPRGHFRPRNNRDYAELHPPHLKQPGSNLSVHHLPPIHSGAERQHLRRLPPPIPFLLPLRPLQRRALSGD